MHAAMTNQLGPSMEFHEDFQTLWAKVQQTKMETAYGIQKCNRSKLEETPQGCLYSSSPSC